MSVGLARNGIVRRAMDVSGAAILLILLLPLLVLIAVAVFLDVGWPILLRQDRLGLRGRVFTIFKFRTMTDRVTEKGDLLPDAMRLTRIGAMVRRLSLDELPQLLNVLIGDMSLIGPRPLLAHYQSRYTPEQNRRHEMLPGITGWAQICGRNGISWTRRFELDLWYIDNWDLWLDLKIACLTVPVVLGMKNISADGHVTISEFSGSEEFAAEENETVSLPKLPSQILAKDSALEIPKPQQLASPK